MSEDMQGTNPTGLTTRYIMNWAQFATIYALLFSGIVRRKVSRYLPFKGSHIFLALFLPALIMMCDFALADIIGSIHTSARVKTSHKLILSCIFGSLETLFVYFWGSIMKFVGVHALFTRYNLVRATVGLLGAKLTCLLICLCGPYAKYIFKLLYLAVPGAIIYGLVWVPQKLRWMRRRPRTRRTRSELKQDLVEGKAHCILMEGVEFDGNKDGNGRL